MADILCSELQNGIYHITLNRTLKHNAITEEMALEIISIIDNIQDNPNSILLILSANGRNFCAGADLNWAKTAKLANFAKMLNKIHNLNIITIVYTHGKVIGGAVGLVSAFDFAISDINASFQTPEISLGIVPRVITPYLINSIGAKETKKMLFTTEEISAKKARDIGLISSICEESAFKEHQDNFISDILKKDSASIKVTKELILTAKE